MREYIEDYLLTIRKENTRKNYKVALEQFATYKEEKAKDNTIDITSFKWSEVKKYQTYLANQNKYSNNSINQKVHALESFFKHLIADKIIDTNTSKIKPLPVTDKFDIFLDREESTKLIEYVTNMQRQPNQRNFDFKKARDVFMLRLMINTGMRISEVLKLDIENISKNGEVTILETKNERAHKVFLNNTTMKYYYDYLEERRKLKGNKSSKIFLSVKGKDMIDSKSMVNRELAQYCIESGVKKISPHKLRHSFSYLFLDNGGSVPALQEQLNHKRLQTTEKYTHSTSEDRKKYSNVI